MLLMKPSVGRIVHYQPKGGACYAALITFVELDAQVYDQETGEGRMEDLVMLKIFDPSGREFSRTATQGTQAGMWHWPEHVQ